MALGVKFLHDLAADKCMEIADAEAAKIRFTPDFQ
jgi:hypothetical protein